MTSPLRPSADVLRRGLAATAACAAACFAPVGAAAAPAGIATAAIATAAIATSLLAPAAHAAEGTPALLDQARRKLRQQDVKSALAILEQAIAADPGSVDAHVLYQDTQIEIVGAASILPRYAEKAKAAPQDPVLAFLHARLMSAEDSEKEFTRLRTVFKDSPWPYAGHARAFERLGRLADASAAHDAAVERAGNDIARFMAYRAWGYERTSQWDKAAESWRLVLGKTPADRAAKAGLGESLRRAGLIDDAIAVFTELRTSAPTDPEGGYRLGLCHMDAGNYPEAIKSFDAALAADRGMIEALCAAAECGIISARIAAANEKRDLTEKDFDAATQYAEKAVVGAPESAYAHFVLGAAHEAVGEINPDRLEIALKEYDAALERLPIPGAPKVRALNARGYVLLRLARWVEAQDAADRVLGIDKANATAFAQGAHALAAQDKQKDAIDKYYKPGIKACPADARLMHDYGVALWQMKKTNDAKKPLEDAVKMAPKNGIYQHSLGELYYELRKYKEGIQALFQATELLPRNREAWKSYAKVCYAGKEWQESAKAFEKVIEVDPESVDEHMYAAVIYADELKDKETAKKHVQEFLKKGGQAGELQSWVDNLLQS